MFKAISRAFGDWRLAKQRAKYGAREGDVARKYNNIEEAILLYKNYIEKNPKDFSVRIKLIKSLNLNGNYSDALAEASRLVESRPDNFKSYLSLLETHEFMGNFALSSEVVKNSLKMHKGNECLVSLYQFYEGLVWIKGKEDNYFNFIDGDVVEYSGFSTNIVKKNIFVIIQTKDKHDYVCNFIKSLNDLSKYKDRIYFIVGDNDSAINLYADHFDSVTKNISVNRISGDFNWSQSNNTLSDIAGDGILIFANNDMLMHTENWDVLLEETLADPAVGVVGARLVYPSGHIQHGGIVLGAKEGEPLHEGLREPPNSAGPFDRWIKRRLASAVTGGFMAVRSEVFAACGGFDAENMPISCSDIDLCLRLTSQGLMVIYDGRVELMHHESLSRGHAEAGAELERAEREMQFLLDRWGERAKLDPYYDPRWAARGDWLFAGVRPVPEEVLEHWRALPRP